MNNLNTKEKNLFNELFVLELANNHWGGLSRGLRIVDEHSAIVRRHKIKAAIKLQIRDVENFVHDDFKGNENQRYIKRKLKEQSCQNQIL